ncbi:MAG: hypothetical protein ACI4I6_10815 [Hominimerdicola sp.]
MILIIECIVACLIFGISIVGSTLHNKVAWLHEYSPEVQKRFIEKNPDYVPKEKNKITISLIITKLIVCLIFIIILTGLVYFAGARDFKIGTLYSYIIWFVVNLFDVVVLDIGIFAHWKKVRLSGTEDMDKEYSSNAWKSIKDGIFGIILGVPISCICGFIIMIIL